jgi:hypothetical protein
MLARLYVNTLVADGWAADEVWLLWGDGLIGDDLAAWAWLLLALETY